MKVSKRQLRRHLIKLIRESMLKESGSVKPAVFQELTAEDALSMQPYAIIQAALAADPNSKLGNAPAGSASLSDIIGEENTLMTIMTRMVPSGAASYFLQRGIASTTNKSGSTLFKEIMNSLSTMQFNKLKKIPHYEIADNNFNKAIRDGQIQDFTPGEFGENGLTGLMQQPSFRSNVNKTLGWPDLGGSPSIQNLNKPNMVLNIPSTQFPGADLLAMSANMGATMLKVKQIGEKSAQGHPITLDLRNDAIYVSAKGNINPGAGTDDPYGVITQAHNFSTINLRTIAGYVLANYLMTAAGVKKGTYRVGTDAESQIPTVAAHANALGIQKVIIPIAGFNLAALPYFRPETLGPDYPVMLIALASEITHLQINITADDLSITGTGGSALGSLKTAGSGGMRDSATFIPGLTRGPTGTRGDEDLPTTGNREYTAPSPVDLSSSSTSGKSAVSATVRIKPTSKGPSPALPTKGAGKAQIKADDSIVYVNEPCAVILGESVVEITRGGAPISRLMAMQNDRNTDALSSITNDVVRTYATLFQNYNEFDRSVFSIAGLEGVELTNIDQSNIAVKALLVNLDTIINKFQEVEIEVDAEKKSIHSRSNQAAQKALIPNTVARLKAKAQMRRLNNKIGNEVKDLFNTLSETLKVTNAEFQDHKKCFDEIIKGLLAIADTYNEIKKSLVYKNPLDFEGNLQLRFGPEERETQRSGHKVFQRDDEADIRKQIDDMIATSLQGQPISDIQPGDGPRIPGDPNSGPKHVGQSSPGVPAPQTPMSPTAEIIHIAMGSIRDTFNNLIDALSNILNFILMADLDIDDGSRGSLIVSLGLVPRLNESNAQQKSKASFTDYIVLNGIFGLYIHSINQAVKVLQVMIENIQLVSSIADAGSKQATASTPPHIASDFGGAKTKEKVLVTTESRIYENILKEMLEYTK